MEVVSVAVESTLSKRSREPARANLQSDLVPSLPCSQFAHVSHGVLIHEGGSYSIGVHRDEGQCRQ